MVFMPVMLPMSVNLSICVFFYYLLTRCYVNVVLFLKTLYGKTFFSLKTQQGLLVDFSAFPQRFIALLQHCHQEENKESPKFLLQVLGMSDYNVLMCYFYSAFIIIFLLGVQKHLLGFISIFDTGI